MANMKIWKLALIVLTTLAVIQQVDAINEFTGEPW